MISRRAHKLQDLGVFFFFVYPQVLRVCYGFNGPGGAVGVQHDGVQSQPSKNVLGGSDLKYGKG